MRKLDCLVAEKIMGWTVTPENKVQDLTAEQIAGQMMTKGGFPISVQREAIAGHEREPLCGDALHCLFAEWAAKDTVLAQHKLGWVSKARINHPEGDFDWSPSTDIAAAWEVVEKLSPRCAQFDVWTCGPTLVRAYAHSFSEDCKWTAADAKTAPLAICLCALRAVGVSEEIIKGACDGDD